MSRPTGMDYDEIVRASVAMGVPREKAERAAADEIARQSVAAQIETRPDDRSVPVVYSPVPTSPAHRRGESKTVVHVGADRFAICKAVLDRKFDTLTAMFEIPPRTKKNHTRWFGLQSVAYTRFRDAIKFAVAEANDELRPDRSLFLPLPDQPYNLAATFYVDGPGQRADLFGLLQGLGDALQDANVVRDDWHFRTVDGSRVVIGDERPRVELTITPIES